MRTHKYTIQVVAPADRRTHSGKVVVSETKRFASKRGLRVHEMPPRTYRRDLRSRWADLANRISSESFDLGVVVSFGYFLPRSVLETFRSGCVNVHPSLLPLYRGAAPIEHALINNDEQTGVSIIEVDPSAFDTGAMLDKKTFNIDPSPDLSADDLLSQLSQEGATMVRDVLGRLDEARANASPQEDEILRGGERRHAPKLDSNFGNVSWKNLSAWEIFGRSRALSSRGGIFSYGEADGRRVSLFKVRTAAHYERHGTNSALPPSLSDEDSEPGTALYDRGTRAVWVKCRDDWIAIEEFRPEGKRKMSATDFANGFRFLKRRAGTSYRFREGKRRKAK